MSKKCFDDYTKATGQIVDDVKKEELLQKVRSTKEKLRIEGKDFETNVGDKNALQDKLDKDYRLKTKNEVDNAIRRLSTETQLKTRFEELDAIAEKISQSDKKLTKQRAYQRAFIGMIYNTNDTTDIPLESIENSLFKNSLGEFLAKSTKQIGEDPINFIQNQKNFDDMLTEFFTFFRNPNNVNSVTKNINAYKMAKEFFDAKYKLFERRKQSGDNNILLDQNLKVRWSQAKIGKINKDEFVNEIAESLDQNVHGDLASRTEIANKIYDNYTQKSTPDWREQGDTNLKGIFDSNEATPLDAMPQDRVPSLTFKDGATFNAVSRKFSDVDSRVLLMNYFNETARELSLVQFFGADYRNGVRRFIDELEKNSKYENAFRTKGRLGEVDAVKRYLDRKVNPIIAETSKLASGFTTLRNFEAAAKLGSATITALMDSPVMIIAGKRLFGLPTSELLSSIFKFGKNGAPADTAEYARYMLEGVESYLGALQERFNVSDSLTNFGKAEGVSVRTAHAVFKFSGLNWWTEGRKAMAAGIYGKELGRLIKERVPFENLNPKFRTQLEKFGIRGKRKGGEAEWTKLLREQPLDEKGRLDPYAIREDTFEFAYGKSSVRQKVTSAMNDATDTMVMTPSQFDVDSAALFNDPLGVGGQVIKSMTQFKAHPISLFRKVYMRMYKEEGLKSTISTAAALSATLTFMGALVLQLKQYLAGKTPYKNNNEFYVQAIKQGGSLGIVSDLFMLAGGENILRAVFGGETKYQSSDRTASNILGPLFADFIKVSSVVTDVPVQGLKFLYDEDYNFQKLMRSSSKTILDLVPAQSLWYTKMLYRKYVHEYFAQLVDPKGYRKREKNLRKFARKTKDQNKYNNFIYESLPNILPNQR
ncbi:hypothetical protein [Candidatus Pelagibacter sp.]|uniref:hypothetical protein n=1 Tax=Candidatus Pelagibacter sp. TaxID=2024849 RepID=UPI003F82F698